MSDSKYQDAAIAMMSTPAAEAPTATSLVLDESKLNVTSDTKGQPEVAKVDETAQLHKEVKSDTIRKSLEHVAREKAAVRAEREAMKPLQALQQRLGPQGIHELTRASEAGDVAAILKALGVQARDLQFESAKSQIEDAQKPPVDPEVLAMKKELEALKAERQAEKYSSGRSKALSLTAELAKDPEFELISDDSTAHDQALTMVEEFIRTHNEMPAETREESIRMALRDVHEKYQLEAKKWEERLTKRKQPAKTVPETESPEQPPRAVSEVGRFKPLTNSTSSAPAPTRQPTPRSSEDYIANAITAMKQIPGN